MGKSIFWVLTNQIDGKSIFWVLTNQIEDGKKYLLGINQSN
jgi:hypothetical protein